MCSVLKAGGKPLESHNIVIALRPLLSLLVWQITFTKTFVQHYAFIMKTLMKSHESDTMSNRIVHISVQLFSNEELARHVTEECQLLDIMVTVLLYMMESCLIKSELQGKLSQYVRLYGWDTRHWTSGGLCDALFGSLHHIPWDQQRFDIVQKPLLNLQNQHSIIWLYAV